MLDLFAGSGALGIEALSRGAASVTFVENDPTAIGVVRSNVDACGLGDRATVVRSDAVRFLRSGAVAVDLALVDPPYSFDRWFELVAAVPASTIVIESDRVVELDSDWDVLRDRTYGDTVVRIASRAIPVPAPDQERNP